MEALVLTKVAMQDTVFPTRKLREPYQKRSTLKPEGSFRCNCFTANRMILKDFNHISGRRLTIPSIQSPDPKLLKLRPDG